MFTVGTFQLHRLLGQGGMGEVWEGVHSRSGRPVAVKVLRATRAGDPLYLAALRREIRAVAALDHPGVVQVLDYGELGPDLGDTNLVPGTPYLAMELADGPSLGRSMPLPDWASAQRALGALLDALAHAHARGVLHRDIKPENVLGFSGPEGPIWKLADFGVAQLGDRHRHSARGPAVGTPAYMAPEQIGGQELDHGPWTDLYSVGCVAWHLISGSPPFVGELRDVLHAHRREPLPPLLPRFSVPEALLDWLHPLLEKDPQDRPSFAADARAALFALGPPATTELMQPDMPSSSEASYTFLLGPEDDPRQLDVDARTAAPPAEEAHPTTRLPPAPFTEVWEEPEVNRSPRLLDAGLGLVHLRPIPLLGRDEERAVMWRELGRCRKGGPRVLALVGPAGGGRSRLLSWICERSLELGAARPALVQVKQDGPFWLALVEALREALGRWPAQVDALFDRLLSLTRSADDARLLARLLSGSAMEDLRPREVKGALLQVFRLASAERPLILAIDDVEAAPEALELCRHVVEHGSTLPVLMVVTLRSEGLSAQGDPEALLTDLRRLGCLTRVPVEPLPRELRRGLLRRLLGLSPELVAHLDERCEGLPRLVVERVRSWADQDRLRAGPDGWTLDGPDEGRGDADQEWLDLARHISGDPIHPGLEIAAVLGPDVDAGEWSAACVFAGESVPWERAERLQDHRLALQLQGRSWSFCQRQLRDALLSEARAQGRLQRWTEACARAVQLAPSPNPERLGRLLLMTEHPESAVPHLMEASLAVRATDTMHALSLLQQVRLALAKVPHEDLRWGRLRVRELQLRNEADSERLTLEDVDSLEHDALTYGWPGFGWQLKVARSGILRRTGRLVEAELCAAQAVEEAERDPDRDNALCQTVNHRLLLLNNLGRRAEARASAQYLLQVARRGVNPLFEGWALWSLGWVARSDGDPKVSRDFLSQAYTLAQERGLLVLKAAAAMDLAELDRHAGRFAEAERGYREAARLWGDGGFGEALLAELNLATLLLDQQEYARVYTALRPLLYSPRAQGHAYKVGVLHMLLSVALAGLGNWSTFDQHFGVAERFLRDSGYKELDFGRSAQTAGDLAEQGEEWARAARCWRVAVAQYEGVGREDLAAALRKRAQRLPSVPVEVP